MGDNDVWQPVASPLHTFAFLVVTLLSMARKTYLFAGITDVQETQNPNLTKKLFLFEAFVL